MPEIRSKSANNPRRSPVSRCRQRRRCPVRPAVPGGPLAGRLVRRHLFRQLTAIQINTAGLSGPYRSDEETMERVTGNHSAVRELRRLLRRSLLVPRTGQLWELLLAASMTACAGNVHKAARLLGASVEQIRACLLTQGPTLAP